MSSAPPAFLELTDMLGQLLLVAIPDISSVAEGQNRVHHLSGGEKKPQGALVIMRTGHRYEVRDDIASIQDRLRSALKG